MGSDGVLKKWVADHDYLRFVVGLHGFTLRAIDNEKHWVNRGLSRPDGEPWLELIQALRKVQNHFVGR